MFPALVGALLAALFLVFEPRFEGHGDPRWSLFPLVLALGAAVGVVLWRWALHTQGVFDWLQGGIVDITQRDPERLRWVDWAVAITRRGTIDTVAGFVRLERRALLGLIPLGVVERPVGDFYRVQVEVTPRESRRRRRGLFDDDEYDVVGYDYAVYLVDRRGDRLCLLDLSTGIGGRGEAFNGRMRQAAEDLIGRPGGTPARRPQPRRDPPRRGAPLDFDTWREQRERGAG